MRLLLALLLLGVSYVQTQVVFTECLAGWVGYNDKCYKFVGYPRLRINSASTYCQNNGASLISVNDITEHAFIVDWLGKYDGSRDTWLTSGIVTTTPQGIQWLGDGTSSTNLNGWHSTVDRNMLNDGDVVSYSFNGVQYSWSVGDQSKNSSFICEIGLQDIYKIVEEKRDFDYGLQIDNPAIAPRGPKFLQEPEETTILADTDAAYLNCMADGLPRPEYEWLYGEEGNMRTLKTGPGTRFTLTGGRLTIDKPRDSDSASYQCKAFNEFGIILSKPVTLSFGELGDFSNVPSSTVTGQVSKGAVLECPKIVTKPAASYQWHKQKTPTATLTFIRPEVQQHTFISNSGKLYFSELAPSDTDMYFCTVSLTSLGGTGSYIGSSQPQVRTSLGFLLNVTGGGNNRYDPVIQDDFIKVYPGNPKRGQTIQLECFAYGTGALDYRWFRNDGEMPRGVTFSESRRVMTIPDVQIEDSGSYRCRVDSRNENLFDEKNFTLSINAAPYFSYPLTDQHIDIGSRLTWHCEARGKPPPVYRWYKDGQPLQNSTGVLIIGNTMVIERVQKERDNGMYQCSAKNLYGTTYSSAQIRVLEVAPTFFKHPVDSSLSAAIGGNITIVCNPEAAPAPTYQWLRNGNDLGLTQGGPPSNGFQMLLNGNLLITDVGNQHQGEYTCKVTNSLGEASSSGYLKVFPSIVISQKPLNVEEQVNETASIRCRASAPANIDVVYVWKFNNHIIDFAREVEYRMGSGTTMGNLFIVGLQYEHEGVYTCQVTTGTDSASEWAYLTVYGPPGEPSGVKKGDNAGQDHDEVGEGERFVRLYWSDGLDHGATILAYTIEFRTNFDMRWRVHPNGDQVPARLVTSNEHPDKRTILLTDLKPWAGHQFRVRAINRYGIGAPSLPTFIIQIPGTAPIVAPNGVTGGGGKVGDLVVRWNPLPLEDYNGPDFNYTVFWRGKSDTQADNTRWQDSTIKPEQACEVIPDIREGLITICSHTVMVGEEFYYQPYEARLRANNKYGNGILSGIATIMSAEGIPTGTPRNVYSVSFNATALDVFWTPVPNNRLQMKGRLTGYRINYWDKDLEVEEQARFNIISVPEDQDNIEHGLIIGLIPGHWYWCNVQSINSAGYGPKSEDYPQETANFAPALYPTEVHVYSMEGTGVRVNFRGISTNVAEEPLMGYKLQYWPSGENIRKARELDVGRLNYGTITNLTESVLYQLRIFGYSRGGQGKRSSPSVYFTVGDGQVPFNPETTEVMAGCSLLQASLIPLVCSILFSTLLGHLHHH